MLGGQQIDNQIYPKATIIRLITTAIATPAPESEPPSSDLKNKENQTIENQAF